MLCVGRGEPNLEGYAEEVVRGSFSNDEERNGLRKDVHRAMERRTPHPQRNGAWNIVSEKLFLIVGILSRTTDELKSLSCRQVFDVEQENASFTGIGINFRLVGSVLGRGLRKTNFRRSPNNTPLAVNHFTDG